MLPLENLTVGAFLRRTADRFPDRPALEYCGRVWSWRAFDTAVDAFARKLLALGVKKGEHVGLWCEAEPNCILLMYAIPRIGAAATLMNTGLQRAELKELLLRTDVSRLLIGDGYKQLDYPALCAGLTEEVPCLKQICYVGLSGVAGGFPVLEEAPEASDEALAAAEAAVSPRDTAYILYTSGTTSAPKAVMGSHYSRVNSGIQQAHDLAATMDDRFCVAMPVFHCFCLSVNVFAACAVGACLYLPESRRTTALLEAVSAGRCTIMSSVPALFHAILCRPDFARWDVSSLRTGFIGGGMCAEELFAQINDGFGFTLLSSLGQTEATAGITTAYLSDDLHTRAVTVGHFMDHVEGRITDIETGNPQPCGEAGEICIRGYNVMQGYYGQPEATAKAIDAEGWLHTGDLGYLDENGNVHMAGRLKELIIRGGENISPAEVEAVIAADGRVLECKAVGVPDRHYGEEVCLCVVARDGSVLPEPELRAALASGLAFYKVPKYILFLRELPHTASGKVRTGELAALAAEKLELR